MTTLAKIVISLFLALFMSSCAFDINFGSGEKGNGIVTEDIREVTEEFSVVSAAEGLSVFITQSNATSIIVEADENVIDLINTEIKNGKLYIHTDKNIGLATKKVYVSLPTVTELTSSSGADLIAQNTIKTNKIRLNASSGSDIKLDVIADEVYTDSSSGADIRISGKANNLYANASSGSDIKAKELVVKTCEADASSGSDISVNVSESLNANASSGGDISYFGDANVDRNKSSAGSITKR